MLKRVLQRRAMHVRAALLQLTEDAAARHLHTFALAPQLELAAIAVILRPRLTRFLLRLDRLAFPTAGHVQKTRASFTRAGVRQLAAAALRVTRGATL